MYILLEIVSYIEWITLYIWFKVRIYRTLRVSCEISVCLIYCIRLITIKVLMFCKLNERKYRIYNVISMYHNPSSLNKETKWCRYFPLLNHNPKYDRRFKYFIVVL